MIVLPDTSIWVTFLREGSQGRARTLDGLLAGQQVMVCGPVVAEILAGASAPQGAELWTMLSSLPWAHLQRRQWQEVGELAAKLRAKGVTVPLTDLEIALAAASSGSRLWTWDSDFDRVKAVLPELSYYEPA
ncbi:MAG: PIN domain-containing protein [Candidatus Dormiibacterota bacterium]